MKMLKLGRRSPKNAPAILFAHILKAIPIHPLSEDYLSSLSGWQMLGNDTVGDCVAVAWANMRRFLSTELTGKEDYPDQQEVYEIYKTQNPNFPNQDDGMDIQTLLEYLIKNGGPDGAKPVAFAKVDFTNLDEVKAALYIFGGILLGVNVQKENMADFDAGRPWDYHPHGTLDGGHCVLAGGYLSQSKNDVRFITWAKETAFTDNFWSNLAEEAWVVIWPENLGTKQFVDGVDLQALADDYKSLTGNDLPISQPTPIPSPAPAPSPSPTPGPTPEPTPSPSNPGCVIGFLQWLIKLFGG
jgi:hypothetical protein